METSLMPTKKHPQPVMPVCSNMSLHFNQMKWDNGWQSSKRLSLYYITRLPAIPSMTSWILSHISFLHFLFIPLCEFPTFALSAMYAFSRERRPSLSSQDCTRSSSASMTEMISHNLLFSSDTALRTNWANPEPNPRNS